ncbi:chaperonin, chloroplastic [Tetrabaena socialis]|uniref:20 kDa chaperonin, chloroplastic n=1 Tax=Tetrabaena socialis TaxID=47790 RepID=A0A2J8A3U6_9CHLO|nr:chaperonin, chloroplastic [Tetrabaena socialis]|eukprot:PNH07184.1 chaperonin, chloroplastic [Tetrabaena socialis]
MARTIAAVSRTPRSRTSASAGDGTAPSAASKRSLRAEVMGKAGNMETMCHESQGVHKYWASHRSTRSKVGPREEDVIGVLPGTDKIAQLQPLSDRILIKGAKAEDKTTGGVLLATDSGEKPTFGLVVAVGPGKEDEETKVVVAPNVPVGATVLYSKYSGTEFECHEADISANMPAR